MKNLIIILTVLFAFIANESSSQDIIILKTGEEISAEVVKVGISEIEYKKYENLNGPIYSILKSEIFMIKYENKTKDIFNKTEEPKPTMSATQQIEFIEESFEKPEQEKHDKKFLIGVNSGFGGYLNEVHGHYCGGPIIGISMGIRFAPKVAVMLVYDHDYYRDHYYMSHSYGLGSDANVISNATMHSFCGKFSYGKYWHISAKLGFIYLGEEIKGSNFIMEIHNFSSFIGFGGGFVTKGTFQIFADLNLDVIPMFETNYIDVYNSDDLITGNIIATRLMLNFGFRLQL